jgi:hypothetical protein
VFKTIDAGNMPRVAVNSENRVQDYQREFPAFSRFSNLYRVNKITK